MEPLKKILFLTNVYIPQKFPRAIQINRLVRGLKSRFDVRVLTSEQKKNIDSSLLSLFSKNNVKFVKNSWVTSFFIDLKGNMIKEKILPDFAYLWHFDLHRAANKELLSLNPSAIFTFGQPMSTHIVGLKLKLKNPSIKWIAHFSDPWVDNPFNDYSCFVKYVNKYYEKRVFSKADHLIFTSEETVELITKSRPYLQNEKIHVIPHILNSSLYIKEKANINRKNKLTIRYLGNFYSKRNPNILLEAIKLIPLSFFENIIIEFIGGSDICFKHKIAELGLDEFVKTINTVSYLDSIKLMQEADLLLILDAPADKSPFLPSKLVDYIGANKPIFGISPDGTAKKLIEEMGFLVADPKDVNEISRKLVSTIENIKSKKIYNISKSIHRRFESETVCNQIADLLDL